MGMFFIHSVLYFTLIDIGSTPLYIATNVSVKLGIPIKNTSGEISMISSLGQLVRVDKVYR